MNRRPVSSKRVSSVGWEPSEDDPDTGTLEVEFRRGGIYLYADVPRYVYQELLGAQSPGRFMDGNVIDKYEHERVS